MKKKNLPIKSSLKELKDGIIEGGFQLISAHKLASLIGGITEPTNNNCAGANCVAGCNQVNTVAGCGAPANTVAGCGSK